MALEPGKPAEGAIVEVQLLETVSIETVPFLTGVTRGGGMLDELGFAVCETRPPETE